MPRRYARRPIKRRHRPRRRQTRAVARIPRSTGFPKTRLVRMKYTGSFRLTPGAGTLDNHFFSMNSINDPDRTGVGHQPYTHDTWQTIYNHYFVVKSAITVVCTPTSATPVVVGIAPNDNTTDGFDFDTCIENPKVRYRVSGDAGTVMRLTSGYNNRRMFPVTGRSSLGATFGSNPTEEAFFQIFARHLNVSSTGGTVDCLVTAVYTVMLTDPKELGAS